MALRAHRLSLAVCAAAALWGSSLWLCPRTHASATPLHEPAVLREDLREMVSALIRNHPHLYRYTSTDSFAALAARTDASLDHPMSTGEFLRRARPLAASVRCLHTSLGPPAATGTPPSAGIPVLPLRLFVDDHTPPRVFVVEDLGGAARVPAGSQVLAIDGVPAETIVRTAFRAISCDGWNETYKRWRINHAPAGYLVASVLGPADRRTVLFAPPMSHGARSRRAPARAIAVLSRPVPDTGTRVNPSPAYSIDHERGCGVLDVGTFLRTASPAFAEALAQAFRAFEDAGVDRLVLDLRGNLGGAPENAVELLSYLTPRPIVYFAEAIERYDALRKPVRPRDGRFRGEVLVLMDGGCASTSGHLLALLRYHRLGTLIGEESAASYTCNDNSVNATLPGTGAVLRVARSEFRVAVEGLALGRGVTPDRTIVPPIEDVLAGRDPVMDAAITAPRGRTAGPAHGWGR